MPQIGGLIGSGRVADVYCYGEHALKLYHEGRGKLEAFHEASVLAVLEGHKVPAPRVYGVGVYEGRWGLVLDRVEGSTLAQRALGDGGAADILEEMVRLQLMLHRVEETRLRPLKPRLVSKIALAVGLDHAVRQRAASLLARLPDGNRICHGDFHPFNIVGTTIIDWLDATCGDPAADACRTYLLLRLAAPDMAEPYLEVYAQRSQVPRSAILAWLPCLAVARLAEKVVGEEALLVELAEEAPAG